MDTDLFEGRRRGARLAAVLLGLAGAAALQLMRTMTNDMHRVMFGALGAALVVGALAIVPLVGGRSQP